MKNKGLYQCFQHWHQNNCGQIFIISDPHFGDEDSHALRMNDISDEELVRRINSKVGRKDTLIILGDVGKLSYISQLKGYKVLIMGNHDMGASRYHRRQINGVDNHLFDEVYEGPLFISDKVVLSHEPIDYPYAINIHGHDHSNTARPNHFNMCVEHIGYTPVPLKQILSSGALKHVDNIHRATIDNATQRSVSRTTRARV